MRVAAFVAFTDMVPVLAADHPWCLLNHQAAGHACRQQRLVGRRVLLKPEVEFKCLEIATSYYNTQLGWDLPFLSDLMKYRSQLQEIGLDCNSSGTFKWLMEGFYPIDLSQPVIDQVCLQPFRWKVFWEARDHMEASSTMRFLLSLRQTAIEALQEERRS
ncbi:hypothetical protein UE98_39550 [Burkholderia cenocepacia]|nr:hypothetical protein UE98_39550 [Burkholderia cenocepacia]